MPARAENKESAAHQRDAPAAARKAMGRPGGDAARAAAVVAVVAAATAAALGAAPAAACPFYTLATGRTNYTNITAGTTAALASGTPLYVCDGAQVFANDTIPHVAATLTLMGAPMPTVAPARLFVDYGVPVPLFALDGTAHMAVAELQFIFNTTLFAVADNAQLALDSVLFWWGDLAVNVITTDGNGAAGLVAAHTSFMQVGIGIRRTTGVATCRWCRFVEARAGAVVMPIDTLVGIDLANSQFINMLTGPAIGLIALNGAVSQIAMSSEYVLDNGLYDTRTFPTSCPVASNATGGGSLGGGKCNCSGSPLTIIVTIAVVLAAVALFIVGGTSAAIKTFMTLPDPHPSAPAPAPATLRPTARRPRARDASGLEE